MRTTFLFLSAAASLVAASRESIDWKPLSDAVWQAARNQDRPLLVDVWGDWCPPCRRMDQDVWTNPEVVDAVRKFICVSVKVPPSGLRDDQQAELGLRGYRVQGYPTIILFDPWRELILIESGFTYAHELIAELKEIPADYSSVRDFHLALVDDRDNSRALRALGAFYEPTSGFGIANRYYREALKKSGAKEDPSLRQTLVFDIAQNEIRRSDWKAAHSAFEHFHKEFPEARQDEVLLGLVLSEVRQKDFAAAARHLQDLESRFPESKAVPVAHGLVDRAKPRVPR
jgi:thiol-disulfide isomerase/thioredoxin